MMDFYMRYLNRKFLLKKKLNISLQVKFDDFNFVYSTRFFFILYTSKIFYYNKKYYKSHYFMI